MAAFKRKTAVSGSNKLIALSSSAYIGYAIVIQPSRMP